MNGSIVIVFLEHGCDAWACFIIIYYGFWALIGGYL